MKPTDENQRNRYFAELAIALKREGVETMQLEDGSLPDFNGFVLAGHDYHNGYGVQFVTWQWSYDTHTIHMPKGRSKIHPLLASIRTDGAVKEGIHTCVTA